MKNILTPLKGAALGLALAGAMAATGLAQAQPSAKALSWYGTYIADEEVGHAIDQTAYIGYTLVLSDSGCLVRAEGFQTHKHYACGARMSGNNLIVTFVKSTDEDANVRELERGDKLFTLTRTSKGLITHWQNMTMSDAKVKSGKYFEKTK